MSKLKEKYLVDEVVMVKFIPSTRNGVLDPKHPLYGGLSSNASIAIPAPIMRKRIDQLFEKDEILVLTEELKEDLSQNSDFWREYRKDDLGMPTGIFPIFLKKEGMLLNKKNALDYIRIRILENSPVVAPSPDKIKNKSSEYRFVLVKQKERHKEDLQQMSTKKQAVKYHSKYEDNPDVLAFILRTFNKNADPKKNTLEFLQNETWKLVEGSPDLFVEAIQDEYIEEKILLYNLLSNNLISVSNRLYFTKEGDALKLDGEKNDLEGAAKYLASGVGQELRLELEAKLRLIEKSND